MSSTENCQNESNINNNINNNNNNYETVDPQKITLNQWANLWQKN